MLAEIPKHGKVAFIMKRLFVMHSPQCDEDAKIPYLARGHNLDLIFTACRKDKLSHELLWFLWKAPL